MSRSLREIRDGSGGGYGGTSAASGSSRGYDRPQRRRSVSSSSSRRRKAHFSMQHHETYANQPGDDYDVNNPPSVPGTPVLGPDLGYNDVMLPGDIDRRDQTSSLRDACIDIDYNPSQSQGPGSSPHSPGPSVGELRRRMTAIQAAEDVCFPHEGMSDIDLEEVAHRLDAGDSRRRRRREWPKLDILEEWSHEEKEQRTMEGIRARKVSEPLMVGGRLRPQKRVWHREDEDAPYRFTYFNEEFQSTIHSQTISELVQPGQTFRDLFIPDPPVLEDSSDDSEEEEVSPNNRTTSQERNSSQNGRPEPALSTKSSRLGDTKPTSGEQTRASSQTPIAAPKSKEKRYGPRPVFWLDVLSPTEAEMKVISKAFGIHPLTTEDILMQEAREKVELFRNYYFVNYRTFEQDENSENFMEPLNMYMVVFRDGVLSVSRRITCNGVRLTQASSTSP